MALITRSNPRCFTLLLVYAIDLPNTDDRINVSQSSSPISGEGIDLCWEGWICLLLLGGTTSVSSGTALGRDDLPDSFPPQMTMILYCPIAKSPAPLRLRARSFCLLYELAKQSAAHNDTPANLNKFQYDLLFSRGGAGARSEHAPGFMQ